MPHVVLRGIYVPYDAYEHTRMQSMSPKRLLYDYTQTHAKREERSTPYTLRTCKCNRVNITTWGNVYVSPLHTKNMHVLMSDAAGDAGPLVP